MKEISVKIADIYVPTKRRKTLDPVVVETLAESILEEGQQQPILIRRDEKRYVLVEGLHRLEALKALGEDDVTAVLVQARQH